VSFPTASLSDEKRSAPPAPAPPLLALAAATAAPANGLMAECSRARRRFPFRRRATKNTRMAAKITIDPANTPDTSATGEERWGLVGSGVSSEAEVDGDDTDDVFMGTDGAGASVGGLLDNEEDGVEMGWPVTDSVELQMNMFQISDSDLEHKGWLRTECRETSHRRSSRS